MILPILLISFVLIITFFFIDNMFAERRFERETGMQNKQLITNNGVIYFWNILIKYVFCSLIGISLRFLQDRKAEPKPDVPFVFIAGICCSYLAYVMYNYYKLTIVPIEFFIMLSGWLGAYIIKTLDYMAKNGIIMYLRKVASDFLTFSKEDKK